MDYKALTEIFACISAASFQFAAGAVVGFSAILIPQLEAPDSDIKVTQEDISWIASVIALAIPIGALLCGFLVDSIGRLNTIRVAALPYMVGWILIASAHELRTFLIGRLLTAVAIALGGNPAIVYITEVARSDFRGALICMATSFTSLGMVVTYAKGAFLHWRTIAWLSGTYCVFPILFMALWSPESPVWLVSKGKTEDALKSLTYLLKRDKKIGVADQELAMMVNEHNSKQGRADQRSSSLAKLLRALAKPTGYKPLFLLTAIFVFQQFSGIYITIFYTVSFFKEVATSVDPHVSTVGVAIVRLIMGIITSFLLKSFGRRPLFMLSSAGMAVFVFISGYFTKQVMEGNMEKSLIPVICIWLYMSVGVVGFLNIPWTMTAEMFTIEVRGMAQGLMIAIAHLIMFSVLKIYPFLGETLGGAYAVQWMFAACCLSSVVFIFIFLPETHKKQLGEIQEYFNENTIYILSRKTARKENVIPVIQIDEEATKLKDPV